MVREAGPKKPLSMVISEMDSGPTGKSTSPELFDGLAEVLGKREVQHGHLFQGNGYFGELFDVTRDIFTIKGNFD